MKNTLMIASISAAVIAVYIVFFSVPVCVSTAAHRNKIPSSIGICPSFVDTSLEEIRRQFGKRVAVGDGAEVLRMGVGAASWES